MFIKPVKVLTHIPKSARNDSDINWLLTHAIKASGPKSNSSICGGYMKRVYSYHTTEVKYGVVSINMVSYIATISMQVKWLQATLRDKNITLYFGIEKRVNARKIVEDISVPTQHNKC